MGLFGAFRRRNHMYQSAAMLAIFLLIYSAIAGRIERSWISGPIVFTAIGFFLGPDGFGVLHINIGGEGLRLLAELTLAMVLFTDAANADFGVVRRNLGLPERLLLIGLQLTIAPSIGIQLSPPDSVLSDWNNSEIGESWRPRSASYRDRFFSLKTPYRPNT